jgi:hypothetical protein
MIEKVLKAYAGKREVTKEQVIDQLKERQAKGVVTALTVTYEIYLDKQKQKERRIEIMKAGTHSSLKEEERATFLPSNYELELAAKQKDKTSRKYEEPTDTEESDREKRRNGVKRR